jgi:hypothetical protein
LAGAPSLGRAEPEKGRERDAVPEGVAAAMDRLLSLSQRAFRREPGKSYLDVRAEVAAWRGDFFAELRSLDGAVRKGDAQQLKASVVGAVERNLIEMAEHYREHPDQYTALEEYYNPPPPRGLGGHVRRPPSLLAEHAGEKYRPDWELLLVAPVSKKSGFMRKVCFDALGTIRNDASIPLLVFLYERAQLGLRSEYREQFALDEQLNVLGTLYRYHNRAALKGILRCVAISEKAPPPLPRKADRTMNEWASLLLRNNDNQVPQDAWWEIIKAVLKEDDTLSEADRTFLEDVLAEGGAE